MYNFAVEHWQLSVLIADWGHGNVREWSVLINRPTRNGVRMSAGLIGGTDPWLELQARWLQRRAV